MEALLLITVDDVCAAVRLDEARLRRAMDVSKGLDFTVVHKTRTRETRTIVIPNGLLDSISKNLRIFMLRRTSYRPLPHVFGFVKGGSALRNAASHLNQDCVLRIDIQQFFPSISADRVKNCLEADNYEPAAAGLLSELLTIDGALPIGLSTSPHLSNLAMIETDIALVNFAKERQLTFTRYVDDLTFSGSIGRDAVSPEVSDILRKNGWTINTRKTAYMRRGGPQYVTGLYVGCTDRPHIPREIKRNMRWISHMIERVGYDTYMHEFGGESRGDFPRYLLGWARYIGSVEPRLGATLYRFFENNLPEDFFEPDEDWREYAYSFDDL